MQDIKILTNKPTKFSSCSLTHCEYAFKKKPNAPLLHIKFMFNKLQSNRRKNRLTIAKSDVYELDITGLKITSHSMINITSHPEIPKWHITTSPSAPSCSILIKRSNQEIEKTYKLKSDKDILVINNKGLDSIYYKKIKRQL